ncbi:hypothetical protein K5X82_06520 [Halosquirtibacter xylanolyticus]|uniref:toxin-antitoxin system YwqK family antitoxin n=1 Tax=Halosquirtibacter xylanolyticus TaxID=3374599 RepID=UPI00374877AD|nr:hypothetical protein K5X82_06520 [Prolixibacteraceae bacterium]
MKYLVLTFMLIHIVFVCFPQSKYSINSGYYYYNVNDYDFRATFGCKETLLALEGSTFIDVWKDSTLANGDIIIDVKQNVLPRSVIPDGNSVIGDSRRGCVCGELYHGMRNGLWQIYHFINGDLIVVKKMNYFFNMLDGASYLYNSKGEIIDTLTFNRGTGLYLDYYPESGVVKVKGRLHKGKRDGRWSYYSEKGELLKEDVYRDGLSLTGV